MFDHILRHMNMNLMLLIILFPMKHILAKMNALKTQLNEEDAASSFSRDRLYITSNQYELFEKSLEYVKDALCRDDLNITLRALNNGEKWAIAMYHASVHEAIGIESGIQYHFGHYDQCLQQLPLKLITTKYCLVDVLVEGSSDKTYETNVRQNRTGFPLIVYWGECVPTSCSENDISIHLEYILQRPNITVRGDMCQTKSARINITNGMFYYAIIICFFVFLNFFCTVYHLFKLKSTNKNFHQFSTRYETLDKALLTFSIIENTTKLFQSRKDQLGLNPINGIKSIAMFFILTGHILIFRYGSSSYNVEFMNKNIKMPIFAFLTNSVLFVDLFLLLSGFLLCRILLTELEKRRGNMNPLVLYAGRYIRLTPAYIAIIGFYMTWFPVMGNGPIWSQRIIREQKRCLSSWWLNILYLNNYINIDNLCMFQSWYLSVDTQLFIVAVLIIYLLHKSAKYGVSLIGGFIIFTSIIPMAVTYYNDMDPTIMIYQNEVDDLNNNEYFRLAYIKTHMRASSYIFGLLTGYIVHVMRTKNLKSCKIPVRLQFLCWIIAIILGTGSMFSLCHFYTMPFSKVESALYASVHKFCWNLSISWLLIAVTTDNSKSLQRLLSSRFFTPISRLTYCAYLSNGLVELYHSSSIKNPIYFSYIDLIDDIFNHIFHTLILAIILCMFFEAPIHALERILLRRDSGEKDLKHSMQDKVTMNSV